MKNLFYKLRNRTAAFVHDLLMIPAAWLGAWWLLFDLAPIPDAWLQRALVLLPGLMVVYAASFYRFGLYRGVWRFASMHDFMRIFKAVLAATLVCWLLISFFTLTGLLGGIPRTTLVLHALLLLVLLGAPRFCYRWFKEHALAYHPGTRVLIVGAGQAGEMLVRDLLRDPRQTYQPILFVDDNPYKQGTEVQGVRVIAPCAAIPEVVNRFQIDLIFIAIPSATTETVRRIVAICEVSGKPFRTLPRWQDLAGQAIAKELRDVSIEDLLGREPVSLDWRPIRDKLTGKTVLISGGGGSIGSELCRQVASLKPACLIILERSEYNLYQIDMELRAAFPGLALRAHLADICDEAAVNQLLGRYRPDVVFHAAAYKHVPLLESQAREALRNNLFGTQYLARAADRHGCRTFVLISTDKAVNPTNVMGGSKRLAEIYCQNLDRRSRTRFVTVRFGNVLDSAGSVVPLFRRQIAAGEPVTVTHPEVCRYFMTIPEASQLIMQAGAVGEGGEIYVLDMGEPINIRYLAEQMILLSGKVPGEDVVIRYTGLRPGEKLHEELFHAEENLISTPYSKLLLAQHPNVDGARFVESLDILRKACERYDERLIETMTARLLAECRNTVEPTLSAAHG